MGKFATKSFFWRKNKISSNPNEVNSIKYWQITANGEALKKKLTEGEIEWPKLAKVGKYPKLGAKPVKQGPRIKFCQNSTMDHKGCL